MYSLRTDSIVCMLVYLFHADLQNESVSSRVCGILRASPQRDATRGHARGDHEIDLAIWINSAKILRKGAAAAAALSSVSPSSPVSTVPFSFLFFPGLTWMYVFVFPFALRTAHAVPLSPTSSRASTPCSFNLHLTIPSSSERSADPFHRCNIAY